MSSNDTNTATTPVSPTPINLTPDEPIIPLSEVDKRIPLRLVALMYEVAELFKKEPERFNGLHGLPYLKLNNCGCIAAWVAHLDNAPCVPTINYIKERWPNFVRQLENIFDESCKHETDITWALNRIARFLRTAE